MSIGIEGIRTPKGITLIVSNHLILPMKTIPVITKDHPFPLADIATLGVPSRTKHPCKAGVKVRSGTLTP